MPPASVIAWASSSAGSTSKLPSTAGAPSASRLASARLAPVPARIAFATASRFGPALVIVTCIRGPAGAAASGAEVVQVPPAAVIAPTVLRAAASGKVPSTDGTWSTSRFVSASPSPVTARTSLITWIFLPPTAVSVTVIPVVAGVPPGAAGAAQAVRSATHCGSACAPAACASSAVARRRAPPIATARPSPSISPVSSAPHAGQVPGSLRRPKSPRRTGTAPLQLPHCAVSSAAIG